MGGNDKTSWLEGLEHDDEIFNDDSGAPRDVTEVAAPTWEQGSGGASEGRTELIVGYEEEGGEKTRIAIGGLGSDDAEDVDDPVTGWLVVVKGPGLGRAVPIGSGLNRIGRSADERVALTFGDTLISSEDHLRIIYDAEARNFLVVPGTGKNVSRINGSIIAAPMPLENHSTLQLSKATRVRFTAFCGEGFDWSDVMDTDVAD